jgi:DNA-binding response OmpR family regulator
VATVLKRHRTGTGSVLVSVAVGQADRAGPVLAAGASGVLSRPYRADEIESLLRAHRSELEQRTQESAVLVAGALTLDGPAFEARAAGRPMRLTLREFELLRLLMLHVGGVVSPDRIRQEIWGSRGETVTANTIAVHVRHLRRHLAGVGEIVAVRRVGYRLTVTDDGVGPVGELSA